MYLQGIVTFLITILAISPILAFSTSAPQAFMIDGKTGSVLLEKNGSELMAPSSMTKILTIYLVFEALKAETLKLEDLLPVSKRAASMQGTRMFLEAGTEVSVDDLIRGAIVQSGNDACVVLAEGLAGSEEQFAHIMNKKARELGAQHTHFLNATGWPDEGHVSSASDLVLFARRTLEDFPEYYERFYSQKIFTYNKISQGNKNPLLWNGQGDGLKTGYTEKGQHGLVGSGSQKGRRVFFTINGLRSSNERTQEARRLLQWGLNHFQNYTLFPAHYVIEEAAVWGGDCTLVPLQVPQDIILTLAPPNRSKIHAEIVYQGPLTPPIHMGQEVGQLLITAPNPQGETVTKSFPLTTAHSVAQASALKRLFRMAWYILWGTSA